MLSFAEAMSRIRDEVGRSRPVPMPQQRAGGPPQQHEYQGQAGPQRGHEAGYGAGAPPPAGQWHAQYAGGGAPLQSRPPVDPRAQMGQPPSYVDRNVGHLGGSAPVHRPDDSNSNQQQQHHQMAGPSMLGGGAPSMPLGATHMPAAAVHAPMRDASLGAPRNQDPRISSQDPRLSGAVDPRAQGREGMVAAAPSSYGGAQMQSLQTAGAGLPSTQGYGQAGLMMPVQLMQPGLAPGMPAGAAGAAGVGAPAVGSAPDQARLSNLISTLSELQNMMNRPA